jgi:DNA-binding Lrp family transcriptional regulator
MKKNTKKSTSKKISVIGTEQYYNVATGNIEDFSVISQHEQDFNFEKFWISQIMFAIDEFGSKKLDLLMHLIQTRDKGNNTVLKTVRELSKDTGISKDTVNATLQILERNGIIRRKIGVIFISPDVIFKGGHNKRMNVLIQYRAVPSEQEEEAQPKQLPAGNEINVAEIPGFVLDKKEKVKVKKVRVARAGVQL